MGTLQYLQIMGATKAGLCQSSGAKSKYSLNNPLQIIKSFKIASSKILYF